VKTLAVKDDLINASKRSEASLTWAKLLIQDGYAGPALVWAVRSVEIFLKEFVLAALFLGVGETPDWKRAVRKASALFESLSWRKALAKMDQEFGPLDKMTTHDGRDALEVWEKGIVVARHNIVHGREEASAEQATLVIKYAEQLILQLKLRLIVARKHPFSDVFMTIYEAARRRITAVHRKRRIQPNPPKPQP
jgi:hypothetical protein